MKKRLCFVVGTRPEFIKTASLFEECKKRGINFFIVHTGQHYSSVLDDIFFTELKLPIPRYHLVSKAKTQGESVAKMLMGIEKILLREHPDVVLVQGDTNSGLAGTLAATKIGIPVGHIEAGLRSYDRTMPEEVNRMIIDHCSDFLFPPTATSKKNLIKEGVSPKKIWITGNTIVDAVEVYGQNISLGGAILKKLEVRPQAYILLTIHRAENTNSKEKVEEILKGVEDVARKEDMLCIFPVHPRTKKLLDTGHCIIPPSIKVINPVGYFDFLALEASANIIFTDSGGVQEESCILRVPCVTLRENTERPETIEVGANVLVGTSAKKIFLGANKMLQKKRIWRNPFGSGKAAKLIVDKIDQMV